MTALWGVKYSAVDDGGVTVDVCMWDRIGRDDVPEDGGVLLPGRFDGGEYGGGGFRSGNELVAEIRKYV